MPIPPPLLVVFGGDDYFGLKICDISLSRGYGPTRWTNEQLPRPRPLSEGRGRAHSAQRRRPWHRELSRHPSPLLGSVAVGCLTHAERHRRCACARKLNSAPAGPA
ncbi:hypothetical protein C2845_PM11G27400 [Panicum miliaceum]|uniref:Uncharacterized protein n=1 Tax=Panicum miliaceum TaxID=4540 RepID=A0A3L6RUD0_PANMI|nr:hypothetical protein C2845_PM11G27400 [Panicum miliaceum]